MKIIYLSNERFPSEFACTIQQIHMCEAFAQNGAEVLLLAPHYHDVPTVAQEEICRFYDVEPRFSIRRVPSWMSLSKPFADGRRRVRLPWVGGLSLYYSMLREAKSLLKNSDTPTIVYSRSLNGTQAFLHARRRAKGSCKVVFEVHSLQEQKPFKRFQSVLLAADGLVVISKAVQQELQDRFAVPESKLMFAPSAVKGESLVRNISRDEARRLLHLPNGPIILYAGQLLFGKGAELLIEVGAMLPHALFLIVGGHGAFLDRLRQSVKQRRLTNVTLTGFVPPGRVPLYLAAADILVLPTRQEYINSAYTSPLKLFEYMAAERPIVCSDLPVLREVLRQGENALFFPSGDAVGLAAAVERLLNDAELAHRLARQAYADVQDHTWEKRAQKILQFVRSL